MTDAYALHVLSGVSRWTITMTQDLYEKCLTLKKRGLVRFTPRTKLRGKYKGAPNGYDVTLTPEGEAFLKGK